MAIEGEGSRPPSEMEEKALSDLSDPVPDNV